MKFHGKHVVVRPMSSLIRGIENLSVDDYSILPSTTTIYCTKAPLIIGKMFVWSWLYIYHRWSSNWCYRNAYLWLQWKTTGKWFANRNWRWCVVWCKCNYIERCNDWKDSIVAAGAVVTKSFPPYSIIGGVPAKLLKNVLQKSKYKSMND